MKCPARSQCLLIAPPNSVACRTVSVIAGDVGSLASNLSEMLNWCESPSGADLPGAVGSRYHSHALPPRRISILPILPILSKRCNKRPSQKDGEGAAQEYPYRSTLRSVVPSVAATHVHHPRRRFFFRPFAPVKVTLPLTISKQ